MSGNGNGNGNGNGKAWKHENKEHNRARDNKRKRERYHTEPEYRLLCLVRRRIAKVTKRKLPGKISALEMTKEETQEWLNTILSLPHANEPGYEIEHKFPWPPLLELCEGDLQSAVKIWCHKENFQWLPATENYKKSDTVSAEYNNLPEQLPWLVEEIEKLGKETRHTKG